MIRFVISDADGTLVNNENLSNPHSFSLMLDELTEKQIPFAVASGRTKSALDRLFAPWQGRILFFSLDGAYCTAGGVPLCAFPVDAEAVSAVIELCAHADILGAEFCSAETSYLLSDHETLHKAEQKRLKTEYRRISHAAEVARTPIYKIILFCARYRAPVVLPETLHAVYESDTILEYVRADVDKALAAKTVCDALHIDAASVLAFGDGENDRSLLEYAGMPVTIYGAKYPVFSLSNRHTRNVADFTRFLLKEEEMTAERKGSKSYYGKLSHH